MLDIQIADVNDQRPLFYNCEGDVCTETNDFSGEVEEKPSAGLSITGLNMRVKDKDVVRWRAFFQTYKSRLEDFPVTYPT